MIAILQCMYFTIYFDPQVCRDEVEYRRLNNPRLVVVYDRGLKAFRGRVGTTLSICFPFGVFGIEERAPLLEGKFHIEISTIRWN